MTVSEALKQIHKLRCAGVNCTQCAYLASLCDDREIVEIVATLKLRPLVFKEDVLRGERVTVGYAADRSGMVVFPKGTMPSKPMIDLEDIGLI